MVGGRGKRLLESDMRKKEKKTIKEETHTMKKKNFKSRSILHWREFIGFSEKTITTTKQLYSKNVCNSPLKKH